MADIKPFRAWRYNSILAEKLKELTAPLSESRLKQKKEAFYKLPFHYYHLSSPVDAPPYHNVQRRVENWKLDQVIRQDALPTIYVYSQNFGLRHTNQNCRRLGFICYIRAQDFQDQVILPHETTIQKAVEYRTSLLEHTRMHTVPTHGFYSDPETSLEAFMEESLLNPIYEIKDHKGTLHRLSQIHDYAVIQKFIEVMRNQQVWIADGHHRYESSVRYCQQRSAQSSHNQGYKPHHYHMMWLTNTRSSDLGVLPTHRILHSLPNFDSRDFLEKIARFFTIEETLTTSPRALAPTENLWTFQILLPEKHYLIRLKKGAFQYFDKNLPEPVKELDVSVLHYFILEKVLGLRDQEQFEYLDFSQYLSQCYKRVGEGKAQAAIITRRVTLEEIERVCKSGFTMPAKATYFFPKVLGGLVFGSIQEGEFELDAKYRF